MGVHDIHWEATLSPLPTVIKFFSLIRALEGGRGEIVEEGSRNICEILGLPQIALTSPAMSIQEVL